MPKRDFPPQKTLRRNFFICVLNNVKCDKKRKCKIITANIFNKMKGVN